jgi:hypothetical protein
MRKPGLAGTITTLIEYSTLLSTYNLTVILRIMVFRFYLVVPIVIFMSLTGLVVFMYLGPLAIFWPYLIVNHFLSYQTHDFQPLQPSFDSNA